MNIHDSDIWDKIHIDDLWIYDKLILSRKLGHLCGPAGVELPFPGTFIVKPITNIMGMGKGSYIKAFDTKSTDDIEPGYFWMELFSGQHLSVDVVKGKTEVVIEGISEGTQRFSRWITLDNVDIKHPEFIIELSHKYGVVNYETIGGKIIEVHLRHNPDWIKYRAKELIPVWNTHDIKQNFVEDRDGERLGFIVRK